jgi:membrane-associated phospholipid phosphatase
MKKIGMWLLLTVVSFYAVSQSLDYRILYDINVRNRSASLDKSFEFISTSSQYLTVAAPIALLGTGLFSHNKALIRQGENAAISFAISSIATYALKNTIRRERPFITHTDIVKLSNGGGYSFPSGHTSAAFAIATSIAMDNRKWYVCAPVFLWAGLVGYSRMDLGVHYPSDVLAGAVVGAGAAYAGRKINNWLHSDKKKAHKQAPTP